ncbi:hypothetical protein E4T43_01797 [Aureobasidium subglaciale]|nr:hypothetical protein E4T43_01797 [Aureobasidium subglaciale]
MATPPPPLAGHLANNLLHTLADLNSSDNLLGISALLKSTLHTEKRALGDFIGLAIVILLQALLISLIRHVMLRTAGTHLIYSLTRTRHYTQKAMAKSGYLDLNLLRKNISSPRRLRNDILQGVVYNVLYLILVNLLTCVSASYIWNLASQAITALLLANYHARRTRGVLSLPQPRRGILSLPRRELVVSCLMYTFAAEVTAKLPGLVSRLPSLNTGDGMAKTETIAVGDGLVLMVALGLRLLVLYPTFAAYVYIESEGIDSRYGVESRNRTPGAETDFTDFDSKAYSEIASLCFTKTALWLALLHFQTVLIVAAVEVLTLPILHRAAFEAEV